MKYTFGDIVVVDYINIGVVVKCWISFKDNKKLYKYDVYVRNYNNIIEYKEEELQRYMVRHKELSEEEQEYQYNAINGL